MGKLEQIQQCSGSLNTEGCSVNGQWRLVFSTSNKLPFLQ